MRRCSRRKPALGGSGRRTHRAWPALKHDLAAARIDLDAILRTEFALEDPLCERILDLRLDGALQRSGTVKRVEAGIREQAYRLWEAAGRPDGCDLEHWLQAEALVSKTVEPEAAPAKPKRAKA